MRSITYAVQWKSGGLYIGVPPCPVANSRWPRSTVSCTKTPSLASLVPQTSAPQKPPRTKRTIRWADGGSHGPDPSRCSVSIVISSVSEASASACSRGGMASGAEGCNSRIAISGELVAEDAEACAPRAIVAAPLRRRNLVGPDAAELEPAEKPRRPLLAGACKGVAQAAGARLVQDLLDELHGDALSRKARQRIERRDLPGAVAPVGLGQQQANPRQMLIADPIA